MKKKTIILVVAHGNFAQSIVETAEMIAGKKENVFFINFFKQETLSNLEKKICKFVSLHKNCNILIFLDMFGGSCFNACCKFMKQKNIKIISGINLPLLLETILNKDYISFNELIHKLKERIKDAVYFVDEKLVKQKR